MKTKTQKAIFGMGCFWGPQAIFDGTSGVIKTEAGFMGGRKSSKRVSYDDVCSGTTGHAEVVLVEFDSKKVSYEKLLDIFWKNHNPTTLNRQGLDIGNQYRSIIFYYGAEQKKLAEESKKKIQKELDKKKGLFGPNKIVTKIVKAGKFYKAEDYHQNYLEKRGKKTC
jgi:peptide-methionine (S)-S-oxide reductase